MPMPPDEPATEGDAAARRRRRRGCDRGDRRARGARARPAARRARVAGDEPAGRFRLPGLRLARARRRRRSAVEFCENGAKALAWEADRARADAAFFARHSRRRAGGPRRPLARPAGAAGRADVAARGRHALPADRAGTTPSRASPARSPRSDGPDAGGVLHVGADQQRGGLPLSAVRARARHQQPARLLEHVPRVERRRADAGDRRRQGDGSARRFRARRRHLRHRPEPGHQPPAHADDAAGGRAPRLPDRQRSTRCPRSRCRASRTRSIRWRCWAAARRSPACSCPCASAATSRC